VRFQISGRQIDIGAALQSHVRSELSATLGKYAGRPTDAQVVFAREGHGFSCEVTVHLSTGLTAQSKGAAAEIYAAFEAARERMDKQLRRYKRRLKDHHRERTQPVEFARGASYILAAPESGEDEEPESLQPIIIAELPARIPRLTVGEAVMQMELAGAPILVFRNDKNSGVNVVYRREDGNIGWIDPAASG
jgi:ribosomal subunit interface protein